MGLFGLTFLNPDPGAPLAHVHRWAGPNRAVLPRAQKFRGLLDHLVVVNGARHADHQVAGPVVLVAEGQQLVARDAPYRLFCAAHVAAQRLVAPHHLVNQDIHPVLWRVHQHTQFLDDDAALLLHLLGSENGVADDVGDHFQGEVQVRHRYLRPVHRYFLAGLGVEDSPDPLDGLGNVFRRRALFGALKQHMLDEVRGAADLLLLPTGA